MKDDSNKLLDQLEQNFNKSVHQEEPFTIEITTNKDKPLNHLNGLLIEEEEASIKPKRGRPVGSIKKINRNTVIDKKLTISLTQEEKDMLEKKAAEDERSVSSYIRVILKKAGVFK